jgi:hypothetical protein
MLRPCMFSASTSWRVVQHGPLLLRDLLMLEMMNTLNAAFCAYYTKTCPEAAAHELLRSSCQHVAHLGESIRVALREAGRGKPGEPGAMCRDMDARCKRRAARGECTSNPGACLTSQRS